MTLTSTHTPLPHPGDRLPFVTICIFIIIATFEHLFMMKNFSIAALLGTSNGNNNETTGTTVEPGTPSATSWALDQTTPVQNNGHHWPPTPPNSSTPLQTFILTALMRRQQLIQQQQQQQGKLFDLIFF